MGSIQDGTSLPSGRNPTADRTPRSLMLDSFSQASSRFPPLRGQSSRRPDTGSNLERVRGAREAVMSVGHLLGDPQVVVRLQLCEDPHAVVEGRRSGTLSRPCVVCRIVHQLQENRGLFGTWNRKGRLTQSVLL